jgi:membrane protein YdbS with pleckstrin-like domain
MEWWAEIGLAVIVVLGVVARNFIYKNKYRWRNDSWGRRKK